MKTHLAQVQCECMQILSGYNRHFLLIPLTFSNILIHGLFWNMGEHPAEINETHFPTLAYLF